LTERDGLVGRLATRRAEHDHALAQLGEEHKVELAKQLSQQATVWRAEIEEVKKKREKCAAVQRKQRRLN
jgi:hypothetical protein